MAIVGFLPARGSLDAPHAQGAPIEHADTAAHRMPAIGTLEPIANFRRLYLRDNPVQPKLHRAMYRNAALHVLNEQFAVIRIVGRYDQSPARKAYVCPIVPTPVCPIVHACSE